MARLNVSVPDELIEEAKRRHPSMNVSRVLQEALREAVGCEHPRLECSSCGADVDAEVLTRRRLEEFFAQALGALDELLWSGGTVEGAARVLRRIALERATPDVAHRPLPRLSRAEREERRAS